jgi:acetyl esterase/lipase
MDICLALALLTTQVPAPPDAPRATPAPLLDQAYGEDPKQVLDLYLPATRGFPTVLFVYGGGWHSGSGKSCAPIAAWLSEHGYGCALPSHRLSPPDVWPAMIEDVARAFHWVKAHVSDHGGDPQRLLLMGHSSGAQLVVLLASDPDFLARWELAPSDVLGVAGLSTPLDLLPHADGHGYGDALLGGHGADVFGRELETMRAASPIQHLTKRLPPLLLVVGEQDFPMLADDARHYGAEAAKLGCDVRLVLAAGRDHMGVVSALLEPDDPTPAAVLDFLDGLAFREGDERR